jgi:hypothetical protein
MNDFKPSGNFVSRVMNDVRRYEMETSHRRERVSAFVFSRPVFSILSAGGILLGIFNLLRIAQILIAPAQCL